MRSILRVSFSPIILPILYAGVLRTSLALAFRLISKEQEPNITSKQDRNKENVRIVRLVWDVVDIIAEFLIEERRVPGATAAYHALTPYGGSRKVKFMSVWSEPYSVYQESETDWETEVASSVGSLDSPDDEQQTSENME